MLGETKKRVREFRRGELKKLLAQCTESQVAVFNRIFGSVDQVSEDQMDLAIEKCERTIDENTKKGKLR